MQGGGGKFSTTSKKSTHLFHFSLHLFFFEYVVRCKKCNGLFYVDYCIYTKQRTSTYLCLKCGVAAEHFERAIQPLEFSPIPGPYFEVAHFSFSKTRPVISLLDRTPRCGCGCGAVLGAGAVEIRTAPVF